MRYFLVTFSIQDIASIGSILIEFENFPPQSYIQKEVNIIYKRNYTIIITSIFEFKNIDDYNSFIS